MQHDQGGNPPIYNPRKVIAIFAVSLFVIGGLFAFGVWWGNERLYSPRQFARNYLNALAARDINYLKDMPGISLPDSNNALVTNATALGTLTDPRVTKVEEQDSYTIVSYKVTAGAKKLKGELFLERGQNFLGLFSTWEFAQSPTSLLSIRISGANSANVNQYEISRPSQPQTVFVPGVYSVQHRSNILVSGSKTLYFDEPNTEPQYASIQTQPSAEFSSVATKLVNNYLKSCAEQHVLHPTGCPFGVDIDDEIIGAPVWTIDTFPTTTLRSYRAGVWPIDTTNGTAKLTATVKNRKTGKSREVTKSVTFDTNLAVSLDNNKAQLHPFGN